MDHLLRRAPAIDHDACVAVVWPLTGCARCQDECPTDAISVSGGIPAIEPDRCVGCGRCAATCPTGAIAVAGFASSPSSRSIFECARVGAADRVDHAREVPCLGGLSVGLLLESRVSDGDPVLIVDRGWCQGCPAGGVAAPWAERVAAANAVLSDLFAPAVQVERRPLPLGGALDLPARLDSRGAAKRRLFRRIIAPAESVRRGRDAPSPRRIVPRAPLRRHAAMVALARQSDAPLPAAHFPTVRIAAACANNFVCAAACPTGALSLVVDGQSSGVDYEARACIACGACERACPERAVSFHAAGIGTYRGPIALTRTRHVECAVCNMTFVPDRGQRVCPACRKSRDLAREGFALFMRGRGTVEV